MALVWSILWGAVSLIFVFVAIGFCIFSHELGHFLAAKWRGLHIDAFSLGFKPFWRKKINGVEYRLGWLPFGGYVELPQVDASDAIPKAADGTELPRAKPLDRIITAVAGPIFNILSGLLLGCIIWVAGMPQDSPKMREMTVLTVEEKSPEYDAGLRPGDKIVTVNGKPFFLTWMKFGQELMLSVGEIELGVIRDGEPRTIRYKMIDNPNAPYRLKEEKVGWPFFTVLIPLKMYPEPGSVAEQAGIRTGDLLTAIDGRQIQEFEEFQDALDFSRGRPLRLSLRRDGKPFEATVVPEKIPELGPEYNSLAIGVSMKEPASGSGIQVAQVMFGSPAETAGLKAGDLLVKAGDVKLESIPDLPRYIRETARLEPFRLTFLRDGKEESVELAAVERIPLGVGVRLALRDYPNPFQQFADTIDLSFKSLRGILTGLGNKLGLTDATSTIKPRHMSGPLGMGTILFNSVHRSSSLLAGIYFMVMISFALAIFNLLPLPVLDGGHILFGVIEIIFRRPVPVVILKSLSMVFVTLLIGLMLYVTFYDGKRLLSQLGWSPDTKEKSDADAAAK